MIRDLLPQNEVEVAALYFELWLITDDLGQCGPIWVYILSAYRSYTTDQIGKMLAPVFELGKNLHDKDTKCTVKVKASLAKVKHQLAERQ